MKPVLTAAQSAALDEAATDPVEVLMERAGLGVALEAVDMGIGYGSRVLVLAGDTKFAAVGKYGLGHAEAGKRPDRAVLVIAIGMPGAVAHCTSTSRAAVSRCFDRRSKE